MQYPYIHEGVPLAYAFHMYDFSLEIIFHSSLKQRKEAYYGKQCQNLQW